ncbi:HAD-like protein [Trichoderma citrinoviride]|uniref:HAD-like protein n=1 Tax=Trichoderma citrinoviride TaxID=58853 RepID=A0A2T4B5X1_9HYPO|nr:HAD-like protein [Trichoderma citrinoviride]PTB64725.1 HAD-like protein [Trichoderma citrinoviride]
MKAIILENMEDIASQGLRVLGLAHNIVNRLASPSDFTDGIIPSRDRFERQLVFHGLIRIYDPSHPESRHSVLMCQDAGIIVHLLTGDHPQTARAIAADGCTLPPPDKMRMLPADVARTMDGINALPQLPLIVARCAPVTKSPVNRGPHRRVCFLAMTGDGVNDSLSLKRSDIGITMGSGSNVAEESSDNILTDDNFTSILNTIEEGRRILDDIQKFILHILAFKDSANDSVILLTPVEIISMLLGTGALAETGLEFEATVADILNRPPQDVSFPPISPSSTINSSFNTVIIAFGDGNLGSDCINAYSPACHTVFRARVTAYTAMTLMFLLFSWELLDLRRSFFDMRRGGKGARATVVSIHAGIGWEWGVVFVAVVVFVVGAEVWKWAKRVYFRRQGRISRGSAPVSEVAVA